MSQGWRNYTNSRNQRKPCLHLLFPPIIRRNFRSPLSSRRLRASHRNIRAYKTKGCRKVFGKHGYRIKGLVYVAFRRYLHQIDPPNPAESTSTVPLSEIGVSDKRGAAWGAAGASANASAFFTRKVGLLDGGDGCVSVLYPSLNHRIRNVGYEAKKLLNNLVNREIE